MISVEKIYLKLPVFAQEILINIQGFRIKRRRFGKGFAGAKVRYSRLFEHDIDKKQLKAFLSAAAEVPYWYDKFNEFNVNLDAACLTEEIKKLPVLEKQYVKKNPSLFINKNYTKDSFWSQTSGTTGSPLKFLTSYKMENKLWAIWERNRRLHGIQEGTWMGWFGGKVIVDVNQKKPPYWRTCYPLKQIMFSGYHLNSSTVASYFEKLKKGKLTWIHSYPSQIALLAFLVKEQGLGELPDLKIITLGSETLLGHQEEIIKAAFPRAKLVQHYGQAEGVAVINQDASCKFYSEQNLSFVEFVADNNGKFKILGTNYNNLAFPLIRYDTGDLCSLSDRGEIANIDGRVEDYIVLPDNTKIGRLAHFFEGVSNIEESQIYQKDKEEVVVRIVKGQKYDDVNDTNKIINSARDRLGNDINIRVEFVEGIKRTKNGKLRFVVSDLKE